MLHLMQFRLLRRPALLISSTRGAPPDLMPTVLSRRRRARAGAPSPLHPPRSRRVLLGSGAAGPAPARPVGATAVPDVVGVQNVRIRSVNPPLPCQRTGSA